MAQTYLDVFLRRPGRTVITFDRGWGCVMDLRCKFIVSMLYHGLDPSNRTRIVFKECEGISDATELDLEGVEHRKEVEAEYDRLNHGKWCKSIVEYTGKGGDCNLTPYVISIYGAALDSDLPGLEYDLEKREISFDWVAMLDAFCAEHAELDKRNKATVQRSVADAQIAKVKENWDEDVEALVRGMMKTADDLRKATKANLKDVRRERIMRSYKKRHGVECVVDWDFEFEEEQRVEKIHNLTGLGKDEDDNDDEVDHDQEEEDMIDEEFVADFDLEDEEPNILVEESNA